MATGVASRTRIEVTRPRTAREFELSLMGAFQLFEGTTPIVLSCGSQRLLAFLALQGRPVARSAVAGGLWPDVSETQAHASLRSAIWRLDRITREAMRVDAFDLKLADSVRVDLRESSALARRLLIVDTSPSDADTSSAAISALSSDLLPDWYDDWAIVAAEDWRQLRLHALEALADTLTAAARFGDAVEAARAVVKADPLRESAHATLIRVHLAEGNQSEALNAFEAYRALLQRELGLEPTPRLIALVSPRRTNAGQGSPEAPGSGSALIRGCCPPTSPAGAASAE